MERYQVNLWNILSQIVYRNHQHLFSFVFSLPKSSEKLTNDKLFDRPTEE